MSEAEDSPGASPAAAALWRYCVATYRRPGVEEACIALQDALGIDVVLLLFAAFAARWQGVSPTAEMVARARTATMHWQGTAVRPLRTLRRQIKGGVAGVPEALSEPFRKAIQRVELAAEAIEMNVLASLVPDAREPLPARDEALIQQALIRVVAQAGVVPDDAALQALATIAGAAAA